MSQSLEIEPITSLEALWEFETCPINLNMCHHHQEEGSIRFDEDFRLSANGTIKPLSQVPKLMVCHDFKGGYGDDKYVNGTKNAENYTYRHWLQTDYFVYFAHKFVTVPPLGWIRSAHRHGVKILGTIITEWKEGKEITDKLLKDDETIKKTIEKLCKVNQAYGFDGYLVNVENEVNLEDVPKLVEFLEKLTIEIKKQNQENVIFWYDSVISDGKLKWQDELNKNNKCFFDVCDGIYLNYNWNDEKLENSKKLAGNERKYDIYVGIDCFGRGCFGGGGLNTCLAVEKAHKADLSMAIFAPGWSYERHPYSSFQSIDAEMWTKCSSYFHYKPLLGIENENEDKPISTADSHDDRDKNQGHLDEKSKSKEIQDTSISRKNLDPKDLDDITTNTNASSTMKLIIRTDFSRGYGTGVYNQGKLEENHENWFNLSNQSFQPYINGFAFDTSCGFYGPGSISNISRSMDLEKEKCKTIFGTSPCISGLLDDCAIWIPMNIQVQNEMKLYLLLIWKISSEIKIETEANPFKIFLELFDSETSKKRTINFQGRTSTSNHEKETDQEPQTKKSRTRMTEFQRSISTMAEENSLKDRETEFLLTFSNSAGEESNYTEWQVNDWTLSFCKLQVQPSENAKERIIGLKLSPQISKVSIGLLSLLKNSL